MDKRAKNAIDEAIDRRFRPFYVASVAVMLVGLYGTAVVPKAHIQHAITSISTGTVPAPAVDALEWLGPQEHSSNGLLNLTSFQLLLPFSSDN